MKISTYIVDSFTNQKFKGNPAGVCLPSEPLNDQQMLNIARELNFSETAFAVKNGDYYNIRFFSPSQEIVLCGHATLATAKILFTKALVKDQVRFKNVNNLILTVEIIADNKLSMEFPAYTTTSYKVSGDTLQALGIYRDQVIHTLISPEVDDILIEIADSDVLSTLNVDMNKLESSCQATGVVVTARSKKDAYDFESRCFCPWIGIDEDPVTGATHTFLTPYWSHKLNKNKMRALQCSERSGSIEVELTDRQTVVLVGEAQIILEGFIDLS